MILHRPPRAYRAVKRVLDVLVSAVVLVLLAPILLVVVAVMAIGQGGPILFRQVRVGRDGRPFTMLKLRTMVPDAEARLAELEDRNERQGPLFKVTADPRITPIGRVLRDTSLDEVPQLWNVLRGQMSLVGPRPALPIEVAEFDSELRQRHLVTPGITGLWQVEARNDPSFDRYRDLDLAYVRDASLALDGRLVLATAATVVTTAARCFVPRRPRARPAPDAPVDQRVLTHPSGAMALGPAEVAVLTIDPTPVAEPAAPPVGSDAILAPAS